MKRFFARVPAIFLVACAVVITGLLFHHEIAGTVVGLTGMIIDAQMVLSDGQILSASALSTNTYDSGLATNNIAAGEPMCLAVTVDTAASVANGNETYQFKLIQSANTDLSSSDTIIATDTAFVTRSLLVKGYKLYLPIPPALKTKRYLGISYVLGGTNPTITVTAEIIPLSFIQNEQIYPKNFLITS